MKFEFSAGGIVLRRAQDFGLKPQSSRKKAEILVAQHSQHHGWVFPKGIIGDHKKGESKEETAVREVEEETGIVGRITAALTPVEYWYQFKGVKIKKRVYYFLMEFIKGDIEEHDMEMEKVEWLPLREVEKRLTYPSDKKAWQEALKILKSKYKSDLNF